MNAFQAVFIVLCWSLSRFLVKILFGIFYYTNLGYAVMNILSLGLVIFVSKFFFEKRNIQFFPVNSVNPKATKAILTTLLLFFLIIVVVAELERLVRLGSDNYFEADFVFGWDENMKKYFLSILLVAPFLEELFVRGVLLQGLLNR